MIFILYNHIPILFNIVLKDLISCMLYFSNLKSMPFDFLTQEDLNLMTSHINSAKRKSTDFSTPFELFRAFFGPVILDRLGISLINANSVVLSTELLKK